MNLLHRRWQLRCMYIETLSCLMDVFVLINIQGFGFKLWYEIYVICEIQKFKWTFLSTFFFHISDKAACLAPRAGTSRARLKCWTSYLSLTLKLDVDRLMMKWVPLGSCLVSLLVFSKSNLCVELSMCRVRGSKGTRKRWVPPRSQALSFFLEF